MSEEPPPLSDDPPEAGAPSAQSEAGNAGPQVYHSEIDPELKTIALKQMLETVKGNGIKTEDVDITKFEGETLEFLAITELKLDAKLSIKHQAGKVTGPTLLQSANGFQEATDKEAHQIVHQIDIVERICKSVLERPDKGLCLQNILIKLPFLHKDFVAHEPCKHCASKGKINCQRCNGKGEEPCPRCQARGSETCPTCAGRQYIQGPNNQNQQCQRCNGSGRVSCSQCHESREISCKQCKATGTIICKQCSGHAWNSVIGMAEINPVAHYSFDRENIPQKPLDKLDLLGADIQFHSDMQIIHRHKEQGQERGDISIHYHIKAPMAQVEFMLKEKLAVPAFLFGTQGKLYDMPPFLEKIMSPGIKALKRAAGGQGDVAALIQTAGRYRTLRHLILATSKLGPKKALNAVIEKNPMGLSEKSAKKLVIMASKALSLIGKKPRQIGTTIGLLTATLISAGYFLARQAFILPHLPNTNIALGIDALAIIAALGMGYVVAKTYIKHAMQKSLETLFAKK